MSDIKDRRKALGWSRADLAQRTALDKNIVQLAELGEWSESGALGRIEYVLKAAENGETGVQLPPIQTARGDTIFGPGGVTDGGSEGG